jgi:hypothetical protein
MPTRRRRSRRPRSRRSGSLSLFLVVVLVAGVGYLLVQRGVLPPPGPSWRVPEGNGSGDNSAAIARLGGKVDYGRIDPATGQRRGVSATITPAMVAAAARDELGSAADPRHPAARPGPAPGPQPGPGPPARPSARLG